MKKIIALLVCYALVLGMVACKAEEEVGSKKGINGVEQKKDETKPNEEKGAEEIFSEKLDPEKYEPGEFLDVRLAAVVKEHSREGSDEVTTDVKYPVVKLGEQSCEKYPQLARTIDELNVKEKKDAEEAYENCIEMVEEYYKLNSNYVRALFDRREAYVKRADSSVLSLMYYGYYYGGGAHGNYSFTGKSFDVKTGKQLELTDVVNNLDMLPGLIKEQLDLHWEQGEILYTDGIDKITSEPESFDWSLDYNGITFYFAPYMLSSFAAGAHFATLKYEDHPGLFNEKYISHPSEYAFQWKPFITSEDVNGDGVLDKVNCNAKWGEKSGIEGFIIEINKECYEFDIDPIGIELNTIFVRKNDGCYLYVDCKQENGYTTYCYQLGETVRKIKVFYRNDETKSENTAEAPEFFKVILNPDFFN